ncbi:MAG: TRAP transporter small permease [Clostridiales bacterium]|nr:TRAP transporter small permease [Clostridiales bacterium]
MRTFNKIIDACLLALAAIAGVLILVLLIMVAFATLSRYLVNKPYAFLIDYSAYALVYITFFGAPWLYSKRGHVRLDLLLNALPERIKPAWVAATDIVVCLVCILAFVVSFDVTMTSYKTGVIVSDYLSTPKWILLFPIPIATFFLAIQAIRNAAKELRMKASVKGGTL